MSTQDDQAPRSNRITRQANGVIGILVGAFVGLSMGMRLGWGVKLGFLFPGDTIVLGVLICCYGGYQFGEPFIGRVVELWKSLR